MIYVMNIQGESMDVTIELTTHHKGWFEFRLSPVRGSDGTTQAELDENLLYIEEANGTR